MTLQSAIQQTVAAVMGRGWRQPDYQTIPRSEDGVEDAEQESPAEVWKRKQRRIRRAVLASIVCVAVALFTYGVILGTAPEAEETCDTVNNGYECAPDISINWGQYSPYYSVPSEISRELPPTCHITFAQILSRHGARDPTAHKSPEYNDTISHIQQNVKHYRGRASFLKQYKYKLGADQLSTFGQQQMVNSGIKFYQRYQPLTRAGIPFVRSAGQQRVVQSAENFTQGFHLARTHDHRGQTDVDWPYSMLVIPEGPEYNNTLDHSRCTAFETGKYSTVGEDAQEKWADIFTPPITKRLNKKLQGADLTKAQTIHLMDLCPFETVAHRSGKVSAFCRLFNAAEWEAYGYYQSLGKYYGFGNGNPLGASQGVGFAAELIARMTDTKVVDETSSNHTLDDSAKTFPLGLNLYADFSHDNDLTSAFSALGLYDSTPFLRKKHLMTPQETMGYSAAWTAPFASRAYFEKMTCGGYEEELVRVIVNDRVLPLTQCGGDAYGRCSLGSWVQSLGFVREGGKWSKCFDGAE